MANLFIIGYPGCGKSTMARKMAKATGLQFVDSDELVSIHENMSVTDVFLEKGEQYFRQIEHEILLQYCGRHNDFVMATGGGLPCFHNNMQFMNEKGITIFINLPNEVLAHRIFYSHNVRPRYVNLSRQEILQVIEYDMMTRKKFYSRATITFNMNLSPAVTR